MNQREGNFSKKPASYAGEIAAKLAISPAFTTIPETLHTSLRLTLDIALNSIYRWIRIPANMVYWYAKSNDGDE